MKSRDNAASVNVANLTTLNVIFRSPTASCFPAAGLNIIELAAEVKRMSRDPEVRHYAARILSQSAS